MKGDFRMVDTVKIKYNVKNIIILVRTQLSTKVSKLSSKNIPISIDI